ncbi:MAG TPA: catalase, partial [Polyangiales bacterium]
MAVKKRAGRSVQRDAGAAAVTTSARSTISGPARKDLRRAEEAATAKLEASDDLAAALPANRNKPAEYGQASAQPRVGQTAEPADPRATASTLTEALASPKTGSGKPRLGKNPGNDPLDRVRTDASAQRLTTNQGVPVADNQHSLKAGLRGPALLEDFILREKITHFDHERIPERIVHARGSAAHGYFECYEPLTAVTRASLFAAKGQRTPVFVRFSTVAG